MARGVLMADTIKKSDITISTEHDVCVAIKCAECKEDITDCECTCDTCEGLGYIDTFEDCWNYTTESHYTNDVQVKCSDCDGSGLKPKEEEDE
jgi:hypothetical protein